MGWFSNFAVSFTIISILSGGITTYYLGMVAGGPRVIIWGWLFVGGMVMLVGAGMAEVCSSFPTAGGLYYWAAKLAPTGQGAGVELVHRMVQPARPGCGYRVDRLRHGDVLRILLEPDNRLPGNRQESVWDLHAGAHRARDPQQLGCQHHRQVEQHQRLVAPDRRRRDRGCVVHLPDAHKHQAISSVFTKYYDGLGWGFGGHAIWVVLVGLMMAQYTLTGTTRPLT